VLEATGEMLKESGLEGMTLRAVAARSGVHHATLSRRWGSVTVLVADAVSTLTSEVVSVGDRGALQRELEDYFGQVTAQWQDPQIAAAIRGTVSLPDETYGATRAAYWDERCRALTELLDRGVDRGELPSTVDPWTVFEQIAGPLWMRFLVTHRPIDAALIARLVAQAIHSANAAHGAAARPATSGADAPGDGSGSSASAGPER
jgi:AcrR family transcriptional regulator